MKEFWYIRKITNLHSKTNQPESLKSILNLKKAKLERLLIMNSEVYIAKRLANKTQKPYKAIVVKVGDEWTQLIFPRSKFEWDYLEKFLETKDETK